MTKLDDTTNFLTLYLHQCGTSEVPKEFHLWCGLATIAAAVGDRVWLQRLKTKKLFPNLYTILLGPSGCGKGEAIDVALGLLDPIKDKIGLYRGKCSGPFLVDYLSGKYDRASVRKMRKREGISPNLLLVTPELALSLGGKDQADQFIKLMVELFTGGIKDYKDGTRKEGLVGFDSACINWIGGSTVEWCVESISREAIMGGFFGRAIAIQAEYDWDIRIPCPTYPPDYDNVHTYLQGRLVQLSRLKGEFRLTAEALEMEMRWYKDRPAPSNDLMAPAWKRDDALLLKLAMILSLADGHELVIKSKHIDRARQLLYSIRTKMPLLMTSASATTETKGIDIVRAYIKDRGQAQHSPLLRFMTSRGYNALDLQRFIETLLQTNEIIKGRKSESRGVVYEWNNRRKGWHKAGGEG